MSDGQNEVERLKTMVFRIHQSLGLQCEHKETLLMFSCCMFEISRLRTELFAMEVETPLTPPHIQKSAK